MNRAAGSGKRCLRAGEEEEGAEEGAVPFPGGWFAPCSLQAIIPAADPLGGNLAHGAKGNAHLSQHP